jgi:hypothetical protein
MSHHTASTVSRRALLAGGAAATLTGCYGSFNLTGLVYDWNGSFSSKWVRWLVFLGLVILPVYGVLLVVDALILNTIEFWTGENPVTKATLEDGSTVVAEATEAPDLTRIRHEKDGHTVVTLYLRRASENELVLLDSKRRVLRVARRSPEGVELLDARGRRVALLDPEQCRTFEGDASAYGSAAAAIEDRLVESGGASALAALRRDLSTRAVL